MPEKRPKWSRLTQGEIHRQRAIVEAKARALRAALREQARAPALGLARSEPLGQLRDRIGMLESTADSLRFRVSPGAFHASAKARQR